MSVPGWDAAVARTPLFAPLRDLLAQLPAGWPSLVQLQQLADSQPCPPRNARGERIVFVPPPGDAAIRAGYEARVFRSGQVEVRPHDAHDLFNALVWLAFPLTKAALNRRHHAALSVESPKGNRGAVRDALTVFDESGIIVAASEPGLLQLLRDFQWQALFVQHRDRVRAAMHCAIFGHALYEKALTPYIGMTGHALLVEVDAAFHALPPAEQRRKLDRKVSGEVEAALSATRDLAPLPVLGVPGWWPANERPEFYEDSGYFRPGRRVRPSRKR
jgi:hypothetical protein